jgi:exopolyphosphatase/guanosine-5'-triphosphate,3'-diphosphate pyrophosphatase
MEYDLVAAVDLGSNSFRLQLARVVDEQIYPLESLKEPVRLASGLRADKTLDEASQARALTALRGFGERLRGFDPETVRAVATNAMRVAKNAAAFLPQAEIALGFPIEIIAGREEARLIFIGAAHSLPAASHRRLVVDIGGGSTEFIIGRRVEPLRMESLYMGCVSFTLRYFPEGRVTRTGMLAAEIAASRELDVIAQEYLDHGWKEAVGSSGTARAIADALEANRLNPGNVEGITRAGLAALKAALLKAGHIDKLTLANVRSDRLPVLPGGVAIMSAVFERLGIEHMIYADGALRQGVLYDLIGRFHHHDLRDATVEQFMRRYQVDPVQAERVEGRAAELMLQLGGLDEHDAQFLRWASQLHEIGISVAHSSYHKHGAYILTYADMPGFSKKDQARLAFLVLGHRGKLEKVAALPSDDPAWRALFAPLSCRQ